MKDLCTIVMYHYVRNPLQTKFPGIKACTIDKLKAQIDFLTKRYRVVTLGEFIAVRSSYKDNISLCVLTFDDGIKDHIENVLPILKLHNIKGTFFIPTKPVTDNWVAPAHKIHFLLSQLGAKNFLKNTENFLSEKFPDTAYLEKIPPQVNNRWDDPITAKLKYLIATLPENVKNKLLDALFKNTFGDERDFSKKFYLSPDEIRALVKEGMEIGAHTHTHRLLSQISAKEQAEEVVLSKRALYGILKKHINVFSYPNGVTTPKFIKTLKDNKFIGAVTVEVGTNAKKMNPFLLRRFDTNDITF